MHAPLSNGPLGHKNWLTAVEKRPCYGAFEFPLYSDGRVEGPVVTIEGSPYTYYNARAWERPGRLLPVVFVRAEVYLDATAPDMSATDTSTFHGGWLTDELAALSSLALGIRLRAGTPTRRFDSVNPHGEPEADRSAPMLPPTHRRATAIPSVLGSPRLEPIAQYMATYPLLPASKAIALVRAARLYSDALWIADAETNLAWLFLVSAVEAAATEAQLAESTSVELLRGSYPRMVAELEVSGAPSSVEIAARHLSRLLRAQGRFLDFLERYCPPPPATRPTGGAQVDWTPSTLRHAFKQIYTYRSSALHSGTPFPSPMCAPPENEAERPGGLATSTNDAVWKSEDLPMHIHMFEFVARNALLRWWQAEHAG